MAQKWQAFDGPGQAAVHACLSPHAGSDLSLGPVGAAIDQASSSVFYSVAFLNQTKTGQVREALDRLTYAIDAILLLDHLHFRSAMKAAGIAAKGTTTKPAPLTLARPQALNGNRPGSRVIM